MWWVVVGCGGLRWVAVGCGGLRWVSVGFSGFQWVSVGSVGFSGFQWVSVGSSSWLHLHTNHSTTPRAGRTDWVPTRTSGLVGWSGGGGRLFIDWGLVPRTSLPQSSASRRRPRWPCSGARGPRPRARARREPRRGVRCVVSITLAPLPSPLLRSFHSRRRRRNTLHRGEGIFAVVAAFSPTAHGQQHTAPRTTSPILRQPKGGRCISGHEHALVRIIQVRLKAVTPECLANFSRRNPFLGGTRVR